MIRKTNLSDWMECFCDKCGRGWMTSQAHPEHTKACRHCGAIDWTEKASKGRPTGTSNPHARAIERRNIALAMKASGKTYREIADHLGFSRQYVQQLVRPDPLVRRLVTQA